jgi:lipoteichoic acid synthase
VFLMPQIQFLPQVVNAAVSLVQWTDAFFVINTVALTVFLVRRRRSGQMDSSTEPRVDRLRKAGTTLLVSLLVFGIFAAFLTRTESSRLKKQWNRPFLVERFGACTFHVSDIVKYAVSSYGFTKIADEDFGNVARFFKERAATPKAPNAYTNILKDQNLIVIHAESIQGAFMFARVGGVEITPNINRIARQGLNFDSFYTQQSSGTSSDSELTFNTSLYPINNGTVFISHFKNSFVTLADMLGEEGYTSIAMHGNNGDFWNRDVMNNTLGYDRFYSKKDFEIDEVIGMGLSDMSFFKQSLDFIQNTPKPFYSTLITLTNHTPFEELDKYGEFDSGDIEGTRLGRYFKSLHYADKAIGYFLDELDNRGLLDDTIIVLYGDHPAGLSYDAVKEFMGKESLDWFEYNRFNTNPFLIWSRKIDRPITIHKPMGMIDVLPTLANMMGIEAPFSFGNDIFGVDSNQVVFPDGSWLDEHVYYNSSNMEFKIIDEGYVEKYVRSICAGAKGQLSPRCNEAPSSRIFQYRPGKPAVCGLGRYAYEHVHSSTVVLNRNLGFSSLILEHDLLRPSDKKHRHSLLDLH